MIGKLKGIIDALEEDHLILDVNGVGYIIFASSKTLAAVGEQGSAASLLIETHIREDHFHLYGFPQAQEKEWFKILLDVQGVGAKLALSILSTYTPHEITEIIAAQDKAMFGKISGVGPKLAARLITELKGKAGSVVEELQIGKKSSQQGGVTAPENTAKADAVSALTNLGIAKMDAFIAVNKITTDDMSVETIISEALKEVSK